MAVNPNKPGTMAYSIWEKNQAKKQAAVVSPATPQGLGTMLLNQQASSVPPVIKKATMPKTSMPMPAGYMPGSTQISKTTGQVVPRRATPTVATAQNPVVSKDLTTKPNISTLDRQGLQDYIDTYNVKSKFGTVKEADALEAVKAQRMLNAMIMEEQKNAATTNPMSEYADKLEQDRATLEAQLTSKNQTARQAKQAELDARYATLRTRQEEAGLKQSQAAQRSTSTSGFGRSTFNADQQVGIEKETQNAITQLEQAKIAEMERFDAEQAGATSEMLAGFDQRIAEARQSAMEAQTKAVSEADRINKETGASMEESIKNLIATGESGGMDIKAGDEQAITMLAQIAKNKDGSWNNAMLSQLPDGIREIVMAASSTGYGTKQGEAAKTISIGSGKNERVMQWNPETNRYDIPVNGGSYGGMGGGGAGGVGGAGGGAVAGSMGATATGTTGSVYDDLMAVNPGNFKNIDQANGYGFATNAILANEDIKNNSSFVTGLSAGKATGYKLVPGFAEGLKPEALKQQEQAERNFVNAVLRKESGASIPAPEMENGRRQYFPQPGDSAAVIAQKERNRAIKIQALTASSGKQNILNPIAARTYASTPQAPTTKTTAPAPTKATSAGKSKALSLMK